MTAIVYLLEKSRETLHMRTLSFTSIVTLVTFGNWIICIIFKTAVTALSSKLYVIFFIYYFFFKYVQQSSNIQALFYG